MPRPRRACTAVQSKIEFPARKTRSQGKVSESKFEVGHGSPRKRSEHGAKGTQSYSFYRCFNLHCLTICQFLRVLHLNVIVAFTFNWVFSL